VSLCLIAAACGGSAARPNVAGPPSALPLPPDSHIDSVFVLESGGGTPEDTSVVVPPNQPRTILIRRGPPDNSLFARLVVAPAPTERRLTIRPRPGLYGVELQATAEFAGRLTLSYAQHFVAPSGARTRYGSDLAFERALLLAQAFPDGRIVFLRTARVGADMVMADLAGSGQYLVAAPRTR